MKCLKDWMDSQLGNKVLYETDRAKLTGRKKRKWRWAQIITSVLTVGWLYYLVIAFLFWSPGWIAASGLMPWIGRVGMFVLMLIAFMDWSTETEDD